MSARQIVETPRLLLRPFEPADIPPYAAIRAKPDVMRFLASGEARTAMAAEDAERIVLANATLWRDVGYGPWAAIERATGTLLGHIGLRLLPELGGETEVLYMLDSTAWGRGFATEGAAAARDFGFGPLGLARLIGLVLPANTASRRVLERIGMRYEADTEAFGLFVQRYVIARIEMPA